MNRATQSLPDGTVLDHYTIDRTLSRGGFSIVYLAHDNRTGHKVVIKEYIPSKLARREEYLRVVPESDQMTDRYLRGRRLFFQEASALAKLEHDNIVHVPSFFRANETVYMVMVYEEGKNLQAYIEGRSGNLSEQFIRTVFPPTDRGESPHSPTCDLDI
ncbi:protein kinase domain-containing protein [Candidatus Reidiella endopervernicosa]|uniref:Protein kinase n=1 Tax=Candidatus Reidiella endopervernicosa TaxID=2738883 RepID=A0A6N0HTL0_9GAMM|nr:protein kinase [Candidatus Reidiella endopervernicosa]QKQ25702.1 protein kinase [Candidatus Reidiella endopervernicosa]